MTTYYVRKAGDDGAAGTSPAAAWATIGKALGVERNLSIATTSGDATILGVFMSTDVGCTVTKTGVPAGATIISVDPGVSAELSANATANTSGSAALARPSGIDWGDTVYVGAGVYPECVAVGLYSGHVGLDNFWIETTDTDETILDSDGVLTQADVGFTVVGSGIPVGATIVSVVDGVSAELSAAATATDMVLVNTAQPALETFVIGDVDGVQTGDAGEVRLTNFVTDDTTAPTAMALNLNGRSHLTFRRLRIIGTNKNTPDGLPISLNPNGSLYSTYITFTDCSIRGLTWAGDFAIAYGMAAHWLFDRCFMFSTSEAFEVGAINHGGGTGSDYDIGVVLRNCLVVSLSNTARLVYMDTTSNGGKAGGLQLLNCTLMGGYVGTLSTSTTIPLQIANCLIAGTALIAAVGGQIVEDYNVFVDGRSPQNANVSEGANSIAYAAPLLSMGDESVWGAVVRPFGMPGAGDQAIGFGGSSPPAVDILGAPRIAAFAAAGAYERGNTFVRETGTVRSGSNAISITGPGYHDFDVPVDAVSTTVTAYVRWDATYAGTKPKMQVLNGTECGVADATDTATGSSGSWEQLSLTFTPSAAGIVTVRFLSSDTNGGGKMIVDDYGVS